MHSNLHKIWKEAFLEECSHANLNKHSDVVMLVMHIDKSGAKSLEEIRNNMQIVLLGQNQVIEELLLTHHIEETS